MLKTRVQANPFDLQYHVERPWVRRMSEQSHQAIAYGPGEKSLSSEDWRPMLLSRTRKTKELTQVFKCSLCSKSFQTIKACRMHSVVKHKHRVRARSVVDSNTCPVCLKVFATRACAIHHVVPGHTASGVCCEPRHMPCGPPLGARRHGY